MESNDTAKIKYKAKCEVAFEEFPEYTSNTTIEISGYVNEGEQIGKIVAEAVKVYANELKGYLRSLEEVEESEPLSLKEIAETRYKG